MVENEPLYTNVDVLSSKSDYFKGMFRSNMRENIDRVVTVPDCSKVDFLQVLEYLCLDDFTVNVDHRYVSVRRIEVMYPGRIGKGVV